jgi:hypothetical protein
VLASIAAGLYVVGFCTWRPDFVIVSGAAGVESGGVASFSGKSERSELLPSGSSALVRFRLWLMAFGAVVALDFLALLSGAGVFVAGALCTGVFPDAVSPLEILRIALPVDFDGGGPGRGIEIESIVESFGDGDGAAGIGIVIEDDVVMPMTSLRRTSS